MCRELPALPRHLREHRGLTMARTVLCFGDSNTWGYSPDDGERFAPDVRWPGVLAARLGDDWRVIEEGLNGRTSAFDDPLDPILNGKTFLPVCLATHAPIDVVVIMLGTNDVFLPAGHHRPLRGRGSRGARRHGAGQ